MKICGYYSLCSAKNKIPSREVVFNFICYLKVHDICSVETKSKEKRRIFSVAYRLPQDLPQVIYLNCSVTTKSEMINCLLLQPECLQRMLRMRGYCISYFHIAAFDGCDTSWSGRKEKIILLHYLYYSRAVK